MFGEQYGDAEVVDETGDGGQDLLRGRGVEGGGRFVQDEYARVGGEDGADGDPLLLAAGELVQGAVAQVREAEEVQGLLDGVGDEGGSGRLGPEQNASYGLSGSPGSDSLRTP